MGYDAACTLTCDGKTSRGTAWLEQKELVFRGTTRLAIPLASISSAIARDGTLQVRFGDRSAELTIGAAAPRWASRIMSPPSRLDKLGVKSGMAVAVIGIAESTFMDEAAERAGKITPSAPRAGETVDLIFLGATDRAALARLPPLSKLIRPNGAIWVVRPKGRREITEADTMAAGKRAGLVDVKVVSFSDTHTAEKFVIPVANRTRVAPRLRGAKRR
jgi:hypothetical protein